MLLVGVTGIRYVGSWVTFVLYVLCVTRYEHEPSRVRYVVLILPSSSIITCFHRLIGGSPTNPLGLRVPCPSYYSVWLGLQLRILECTARSNGRGNSHYNIPVPSLDFLPCLLCPFCLPRLKIPRRSPHPTNEKSFIGLSSHCILHLVS